jgi:hypothetical protein
MAVNTNLVRGGRISAERGKAAVMLVTARAIALSGQLLFQVRIMTGIAILGVLHKDVRKGVAGLVAPFTVACSAGPPAMSRMARSAALMFSGQVFTLRDYSGVAAATSVTAFKPIALVVTLIAIQMSVGLSMLAVVVHALMALRAAARIRECGEMRAMALQAVLGVPRYIVHHQSLGLTVAACANVVS